MLVSCWLNIFVNLSRGEFRSLLLLCWICVVYCLFTKVKFYSVLCSVVKVLLSFLLYLSILVMIMSVLCFFMFSFWYFSILVMSMSVLCSIIEVLFSFFSFFFVFFNFLNALQMLVMHHNLWVYLSVFIFIDCVFILWYFMVIIVICSHIILFGRLQYFHLSVISIF